MCATCLSHEVDARGDGTRPFQQSTTQTADTMRASDQMDSYNIRAALQILHANARAPQNPQVAAEVHSLCRRRGCSALNHAYQCAVRSIEQAATKFPRPPAKLVKRLARAVVLVAELAPADGETLKLRPLDALRVDRQCADSGDGPAWDRETMDGGNNRLIGLWPEEIANATALATEGASYCTC